MKTDLVFLKKDNGFIPAILVKNNNLHEKWFEILDPICLFLKGFGKIKSNYSLIQSRESGIVASKQVEGPEGSSYNFTDLWSRVAEDTYELKRKIKVNVSGKSEGFRSLLSINTTFPDGTKIRDFEYIIPAAFYKDNDSDHDGVEDYYGTYNLCFRDELPSPVVLGYHPLKQFYISLIRSKLPQYDPAISSEQIKKRQFVLDTDIGSLGIASKENESSHQVMFQAYYPFYAGEKSYDLNLKGDDWGAFKPNKEGLDIEITYQIKLNRSISLIDAWGDLFKYLVSLYKPVHATLSFPPDDILKHRINLLEHHYKKWDKDYDPREPAGFIVECDPRESKASELVNGIEYGFSGHNLLAAYGVLRYGYETKKQNLVSQARNVIEFFVRNQHKNGMVSTFYNVNKKSFSYWFKGCLLPFSYTSDEKELEKYMQKSTIEEILPIAKKLRNVKGSGIRPMAEAMYNLLLCYKIEKNQGIIHEQWLRAAIKFGDLVIAKQNSDGSWYKAYTLDCKELTEPAKWFGFSDVERKSSTSAVIPFLLKLYEIIKDKKYLRSAIKAGDFVNTKLLDTAEPCGMLEDTNLVKRVKLDSDATKFALNSQLYLYEVTKEERFLSGAEKAGILYSSWTFLWNTPFPPNTRLGRLNFKSTGLLGCDVLALHFTDLYAMYTIRDLLKLAEITQKKELFTLAEICFYGFHQLMATPSEMFGYKEAGMCEEGYLVGYWNSEDTSENKGYIFTGAAEKSKGNGNGACYTWIPAKSIYGIYRIIDEYGTLDFEKIRDKIGQDFYV